MRARLRVCHGRVLPHPVTISGNEPAPSGRVVEEIALHVLHVVPTDLARGAQVYARALVDSANRVAGDEHEIAVLFAGQRVAVFAEHELGVTSGRLHTAGLDPRAVWRLWRLVRRTRPDVVVAHGAESLKYAVFARGRNRQVVCHSIGVVSPKAQQGASHALHRALLRRADLVIAVSNAVAQQLHDLFGVGGDRLQVIPNGREPSAFAATLHAPTDAAPGLLFVGHLTATKRPEVFVEVVSMLRRRGCPVDAVMVGDGPLEDALARPAVAAGVALMGRRSDVASFLTAADVFVFPSIAEGEGMPGVLIEAGLAGVPVVATDVPGVRDVIVDGETGRVVQVDDVAGLADAVEELLRAPVLRAAMGASARVRCERLFSLDACTARWVEELSRLAAPREPRRRVRALRSPVRRPGTRESSSLSRPGE